MPKTVLVTGASGFIGSHLATALVAAGHDVRAMTRHPDDYDGAGKAVPGDVEDVDSLRVAMDGADAAYYLVHSLGSDDFEKKDAEAARNFGSAAADAGLERIVYLGGSGTTGRTCPRTCAPGVKSRVCSARPASRSPCCGRRWSSATAGSPGRSPVSSWPTYR